MLIQIILIYKYIEEKILGFVLLLKKLLGLVLNFLNLRNIIIFTEMLRFGRNSSEMISQLQLFIKENLNIKNINNKFINISVFINLKKNYYEKIS